MVGLTPAPRLAGLALAVLCFTGAAAQHPKATELDCSNWTLDGYRLGMRGDELLSVRSVTLHIENQAQAIEPGRLQGVLVLDVMNRLQKWDVRYESANGEELRSLLEARLGEPTSDVAGDLPDDGTTPVRQRRTTWWSTACDAAIVVYENEGVSGAPGRTVSATLARTAMFPPGLVEMKTLFD